jgi:transcriptional regulator with XRE-family HTH domain
VYDQCTWEIWECHKNFGKNQAMQHFGEYLSNLRSNKGLTLEKLAKRVGSSKSTVSRLENNDIPRPFKGAIRRLIIQLAQVLCTSKQETERYLTLAGIDITYLTESEKKLVGLLPHISINTPAEPRTHGILLLNFAHSLTVQQRVQIEELSKTTIENIVAISTLINEEEPLESQITSLIEAVDQSIPDWHKRDMLINPPGYAPAAFLLLAEIHGRIGHFPTFIRMRPIHSSVTTYEVIELLNLQIIRDAARKTGDISNTPSTTLT